MVRVIMAKGERPREPKSSGLRLLDPASALGQKLKSSTRADHVRFAPVDSTGRRNTRPEAERRVYDDV